MKRYHWFSRIMIDPLVNLIDFKDKFIPVFLLIISCMTCKPGTKNDEFHLRIRIKEDIDCLHPILSRSSVATQIEQHIMMPMIEFSPDKIELTPLMCRELPKLTSTHDSISIYEYDILPEAMWDNGSPIQASDYLFTIKAALNPYSKNPSAKSNLKYIADVIIDSVNLRHVKILVKQNYLLAIEMCGNVNIYPEYHYDSSHILRQFSLHDLLVKDTSDWLPQEKTELLRFTSQFENAEMCKSKISGAGPYRLALWEPGARIVLEKKKNWWGNQLVNTNPMLRAYPDKIEYLIMPDEAAAILALKNGSIDLATEITPIQFHALQKEAVSSPLQFFSIDGISQYTFLELNTRRPGLSEANVRRALSKLIDVPGFIKNVMYGFAEPVTGPIHPSRSFYNKNLKPILPDPAAAAMELSNAGWKDSDKDGIRDKMIEGKKTSLSFSLLVSSETGKKLALIFQEEAIKAGIEIKPELKEFPLMQKDLNELNFDIAALTLSQSPSLYDPFQSWHSTNTRAGGSNRCGFATPQTDSLIQIIRLASTEDERNNAYYKFQEILYSEQPQIFLFSPKQRIVARTGIVVEPSKRRPGYAENLIRKKE